MNEETELEERRSNNVGVGWDQGKPKLMICLRLPQGNALPESQAGTHPLSTVSRARR